MPKYNPKSTASEQIVAKILEIMEGMSPAEAWNVVKQPKPADPKIELGWTPELMRDVLSKRRYETTLKVVNEALSLLHESGRVSRSVGEFGFDTYELIAAKQPHQ